MFTFLSVPLQRAAGGACVCVQDGNRKAAVIRPLGSAGSAEIMIFTTSGEEDRHRK